MGRIAIVRSSVSVLKFLTVPYGCWREAARKYLLLHVVLNGLVLEAELAAPAKNTSSRLRSLPRSF